MAYTSIYSKITKIREKDRFSFLGSVHWLRALAILCKNNQPSTQNYIKNLIQLNDDSLIQILNSIQMSLHYYGTLIAIKDSLSNNKAQILSRISIVAWYYGIYNAAQAMITVSDGSMPKTNER